ncbi:MAG TPA: hypothetical protein VGF92_02800 [Stellaceae bacterium]|jgi:hypothetical protein
MVAYSFQKQFAMPILDEIKGGTIRGARKRHGRPGEELQLYTGMRTRHCKLITRKQCLACAPIWLGLRADIINVALDDDSKGGIVIAQSRALDVFARFDGFGDWGEMKFFWLKDEDFAEPASFAGWNIRWLPLPKALF